MRLLSSAVVAALALGVPAMAQEAAKKPKATYHKKDVKTVKATVKSIDVPTRHVVLTTADGKDHEFVVGKQAKDGSDHIIYNQKNGQLLYDHDGKGGKDAVVFAKIQKGLDIDASDFLVI